MIISVLPQSSLTSVEKCGDNEEKADQRRCIEEEEDEGHDWVTVSEYSSRVRLELAADEDHHDQYGDRADDGTVDVPAHPMHPTGESHQLHQFLHSRLLLIDDPFQDWRHDESEREDEEEREDEAEKEREVVAEV